MSLNNSGQQTQSSRRKTFYDMERRQKWWAGRAKKTEMVGSKSKTSYRSDYGPKKPGRVKVLQHISCSVCQMVSSYSKNKAPDFPGVAELRMLVLAGLPVIDRRTLSEGGKRYYPLHMISIICLVWFFFSFNLSSILTAWFSIQNKSSKPVCVWDEASPSVGAQIDVVLIPVLPLSPRRRRNLCSLPGSHRAAETPGLPLPLHAVSQPSCDSSTACLCLQQSASSYCQIISLLKTYLRSSSCHEALQKSSCQPPAWPPHALHLNQLLCAAFLKTSWEGFISLMWKQIVHCWHPKYHLITLLFSLDLQIFPRPASGLILIFLN